MRGKNASDERRDYSGIVSRTRRRLLAAGTGGGAVLVALVMVFGQASALVAPHTVMTAPYHKTAVGKSNYQDSSGCAKGKLVKPAGWRALTGIGKVAVKANAKACTGLLAAAGWSSYGDAFGEFAPIIPLAMSPGVTSVSPSWTMTSKGVESFTTSGNCPSVTTFTSYGYASQYCYASSSASLFAYAYVWDMTNGSYFFPSNYWPGHYNSTYMYNDTYCYSYTCYYYNYSYGGNGGWSGSETVTLWINSTWYTSAHSYALLLYVYASAYADIYGYGYPVNNGGYPGASLAASVNMASGPNYATLSSITLT